MMPEDDLETVAGRVWPALELLIDFLAEGIEQEYARCEEEGIDPLSDAATFAATVRRFVFNAMRPHLPLPSKAPMSPLHIDLGPYQLKVLRAAQGTVPYPRTDARRAFYQINELGILAMNMPVGPLVEIDEEIDSVEEGSLVLIWYNIGPVLAQAELYRPTLTGFPGPSLDLLATTEVVEDDDFPDVRRDDEGDAAEGEDEGEGSAATGN